MSIDIPEDEETAKAYYLGLTKEELVELMVDFKAS